MKPREPADFEWDKAQAHLAEAAAHDSIKTPMSLVHAAYYAAFHAALAVLLLKDKASPKKHGIVVQQFGLEVRDLPEPLLQAGRDLRKLKELRTKGDYDREGFVSASDAEGAMRMAQHFVSIRAKQFGFPRGQSDRRD